MSVSHAFAVDEVLARLERHAPAIIEEASALLRSDFVPWPVAEAFAGDWRVFGLLLGKHSQAGMEGIDVAANRRRCPRTWAAIRGLPYLADAGFSWLGPGTHVYPHADEDEVGRFRCHLGLIVPPGCLFRMHGQTRTWEVGKAFTFDGRIPHEAGNTSGLPRVVLICDFSPP